MENYDKDGDGKLSFEEFCTAMVPRDKNYAALIMSRKPYNDNSSFPREQPFTPDTLREFLNLLNQLIAAEVRSDRIRDSLNQRPKFDISLAYKSLIRKAKQGA